MIEEIFKFKYILIPAALWLGIQLFKVIYEFFETKKWDWSRIIGSGGMPSSHSAVVSCLATMVGRNEGVTTTNFAISLIFALVVMHDAAGIRRNVGKQAKIINSILMDNEKTGAMKLQEMTGHTPFQVLVGALIGVVVGLIF